MPELISKTALDGRLPISVSQTTLSEVDPGPITSVSVMPGGTAMVAKGLKPLGLTFPVPNSFTEKNGIRLVWTGREQAFLIGQTCPELKGAAVTDQSGGWVSLCLTGPCAVDALARYIPLDLRLSAFPVGRAVRTGLYHMNAIVFRTAEDSLTLMVFRSMARTAWHEIDVALHSVAARRG